MNNTISNIRDRLHKMANKKLEESGKRFFKESVKMYGTKTGEVVTLGKAAFKDIEDKPKREIFAFCEKLWKSGYMEESFIACEWTYRLHKQYMPEDFHLFQRWIDEYVTNWASCDTFSNHSVGAFIEMYPKYVENLKIWATSKNRWMRRAAAVSLIIPARHGKFLKDIFEIASILLLDNDDLVQKGYGWMLKAASQAHQKEVFDFVMQKKNVMPRTALRYAIEKMPKTLRYKAMEK